LAIKAYRYITRIDQVENHNHGWYVRMTFRGEKRVKWFPDNQYGGIEESLQAALTYRAQAERELGKPHTTRRVAGPDSRNHTGIPGIRRVIRRDKKQKTPSEVYEVTWCPEPRVIRRTSVSIRKHGEKEAFRRACAIRRQKEREIYGDTVVGNWQAILPKLCDN
jgi:hypothetical protein